MPIKTYSFHISIKFDGVLSAHALIKKKKILNKVNRSARIAAHSTKCLIVISNDNPSLQITLTCSLECHFRKTSPSHCLQSTQGIKTHYISMVHTTKIALNQPNEKVKQRFFSCAHNGVTVACTYDVPLLPNVYSPIHSRHYYVI